MVPPFSCSTSKDRFGSPRRTAAFYRRVIGWRTAAAAAAADARYDGTRGEGVLNPHADVGAAMKKAVEACSFEEETETDY